MMNVGIAMKSRLWIATIAVLGVACSSTSDGGNVEASESPTASRETDG
jgi:hypothetical protein